MGQICCALIVVILVCPDDYSQSIDNLAGLLQLDSELIFDYTRAMAFAHNGQKPVKSLHYNI